MRTDAAPRPTRALVASWAVALLTAFAAVGGAGRDARAEEAWEASLPQAISDQDAEIQRSSVTAVIRRLESRVARTKDTVDLYLLARAYGKAGQQANALTVFGEILATRPGSVMALLGRAKVRMEQKPPDRAGAEADAEAAVRLQPNQLTALRLLAEIKRQLQKKDAVLQLLRRIVDIDPRDDVARVQTVETYLDLGNGDEALRALHPLLAKAPRDPNLRLLKGRAETLRKDWAGALATLRPLAQENPNWPPPLIAYVGVVQAYEKAGVQGLVTREDYQWALQGLLRVEKDPERRKILGDALSSLNRPDPAVAPKGPPPPEQQVQILKGPDPRRREVLLRWFLTDEATPPSVEVLQAVVSRLGARSEPDTVVRRLAILVLGRHGKAPFGAIVRHSLKDPDPEVQALAADALRGWGSVAALPALKPHAAFSVTPAELAAPRGEPEAKRLRDALYLAVATREAIYALAGVNAPSRPDDPPDAQARAFDAWWKSSAAREPKIRAIDAIVESRDLIPEDVLYPLLVDHDPQVWPAAYRALKTLALGAKKPDPAYDAWLRSIPLFADEVLVEPRREATLTALLAWLERNPRTRGS
jgi:tetratricopeptide (TPR) repeat protein